jgi:hypothetical protein
VRTLDLSVCEAMKCGFIDMNLAMTPWREIICALCFLLLLSGCTSTLFNVPENTLNDAEYSSLYPWYAEFCALSEIRKKPDFGAKIVPGGPGGHSILYLNGACRVKDAGYPVLALCGAGDPRPGEGAALSVNDHYRNVNWIATDGWDFVMHGDLAPGEPLTRKAYLRTETKAKAMGILDGVEFHEEYFKDQPASMSKIDLMYDLSIATDYAVNLGRDRYCARIPLNRAKMSRIVDYLNAVNAPYRSGQQVFHWNVLQNNCAHLAHNALAQAGVWPEWPTRRFVLIAAFDFPVPKNEFVNLMRRTNDMPISDPSALYEDGAARAALLDWGWIATSPGGIAEAERAVQQNDVYDTNLRLIFYDDPPFGHYQERFEEIFGDPRYTNLRANLTHFESLYSAILAARPATESSAATGDRALFYAKYYQSIIAEKAKAAEALRRLPAVSGQSS